jgi:methionyl-tRNA synthetase
MPRILVAVAWPYANGPFHIGHLAGAYLPADIFARFHRLMGHDVLMVSGSDMHGTPVLVRAETEGTTAEAIARRYDDVNRKTFEALGFSFDVFTSTHTPLHERTVHEVFLTLLRNGYIDRRTEEYAFCPRHQRFLPDRYLNGECPYCGYPKARGDECDNCGRVIDAKDLKHPVCALDGTPAEFRPSEHFCLRLDKLAPSVERFLEDKQYWRPNVITFTQNFRKSGLKPTPITRDIDWGIPIPLDGYPTKRFYVWFEAVIGYLSATREWAIRTGDPDAWHKFWDPGENVRSYYFVGKDNIYYHTIFWPAMLIGQGQLATPYDVPANEWLVTEGSKLSKSRAPGEDVHVAAMLTRYPADAIRFYAALLAPQNHDTEFQWEEFHQVTEGVLANQWGNLVQRLLVFARDRCGGKIPAPPAGWDPQKSELRSRLLGSHAQITQELEAVHLKEALELMLTEIREANKRFHAARPWSATPDARDLAVYEGIWLVGCAATWLAPYLPHASAQVFRMLGYAGVPDRLSWARATEPPPPGQSLGDVRPLFPRSAPEEKGPSSATPAAVAVEGHVPDVERPLDWTDAPLDIRAGLIRTVAPHPSADRLYQLSVDLGAAGFRTVVAGLRPFLPPEALEGQRIALLANLQPRTIRSVTSHGMLLAAEAGEKVTLLHPPDSVELGDFIEGGGPESRTITIEEFERTPLRVGLVEGPGEAGESRVSVGDHAEPIRGDWPVGARVVLRTWPAAGHRPEVVAFTGGRPLRVGDGAVAGAKIR